MTPAAVAGSDHQPSNTPQHSVETSLVDDGAALPTYFKTVSLRGLPMFWGLQPAGRHGGVANADNMQSAPATISTAGARVAIPAFIFVWATGYVVARLAAKDAKRCRS